MCSCIRLKGYTRNGCCVIFGGQEHLTCGGDRFDMATLVRAQLDDPAAERIVQMLTHLVFGFLDASGQIDKAPRFSIFTS